MIPLLNLLEKIKDIIYAEVPKPVINCTFFKDNKSTISVATALSMLPCTKHITLCYHHFALSLVIPSKLCTVLRLNKMKIYSPNRLRHQCSFISRKSSWDGNLFMILCIFETKNFTRDLLFCLVKSIFPVSRLLCLPFSSYSSSFHFFHTNAFW